MKTLTYSSPRELEQKTKRLLEGYQKSVQVAKADLKKARIPFASSKYGVKVNPAEVSMIMVGAMQTKGDYIKQVLLPSTEIRMRYEAECGVVEG